MVYMYQPNLPEPEPRRSSALCGATGESRSGADDHENIYTRILYVRTADGTLSETVFFRADIHYNTRFEPER